jgi:hypothetical protein
VKPRLADDVHFVPRPDGVFVLFASQPDHGFGISGRHAYQWLVRIAPFLTGEHDLDALMGSVNEQRRSQVRALIARLHGGGAVRDASGDLPHTLSREVRDRYAPVIGFIGLGADSPEHRFQRYRECHPVVVGSGPLVAPLVQALLTTGVARVQVLRTADQPTDLDRMRACLALVGPDAWQRVQITDSLAATTGGVLHVSDLPDPDRRDRLAASSAAHGRIFGSATVAGDVALIGPVGDAARLTPGPETVACDDGTVSDLLTGPVPALVANHLCAAFLKQVTGLPNDAAERIVELDLETLRTRVRPLVAAS